MSKKEKKTEASNYFRWDKKSFINQKINNNRGLDWFKNRYKRNLTIALFFTCVTFFNATMSVYLFKIKNENIQTYLTASSGQVIKYKMSDEKRVELRKALKKIRTKQK